VQEVVADRPHDAEDVDARIGPEALVLGRDRGVHDQLGQLVVPHDIAPLLLELIQEVVAVAVVELRGERQRVFREVRGVREVGAEEGERRDGTDGRQGDTGDEDRGEDRREDREPAANAAPSRAPKLLIWPPPERVVACGLCITGDVSMLTARTRDFLSL
jgi:hypothetical protein